MGRDGIGGVPYISIMISLGCHRMHGPDIFSYIYWLMLMASMQVNIPVPWILWGWERQTGNLTGFGLDNRSRCCWAVFVNSHVVNKKDGAFICLWER